MKSLPLMMNSLSVQAVILDCRQSTILSRAAINVTVLGQLYTTRTTDTYSITSQDGRTISSIEKLDFGNLVTEIFYSIYSMIMRLISLLSWLQRLAAHLQNHPNTYQVRTISGVVASRFQSMENEKHNFTFEVIYSRTKNILQQTNNQIYK